MTVVNCPILIDNYIAQSTPTTNYGGSSPIVVGVDGNTRRILLKPDLTSIPAGSFISSAVLYLYAESWGYGDNYEEVSRILVNWDEYNSTYNNRLAGTPWNSAGCAGSGSDYTATGAASLAISGAVGWKTSNITTITKSWIEGLSPTTNYGVRISNTNNRWANITSRHGANTPYLQVTYTAPGPLTSSFTVSRSYRSDTYGQKTTTYSFTDTSTGVPLTWNWERRRSDVVGDPWVSFSTSQNPTTTFPYVRDWDIRLTVTNGFGSDTHTEDRYVHIWFGFSRSTTQAMCSGTYLHAGNPNTNYVGANPDQGYYTGANERRILVKCDFSSIVPVSAKVDNTIWHHWAYKLTGYSPGGETSPQIARLLVEPTFNQATWNQRATGVAWNTSGCKGSGTDYTNIIGLPYGYYWFGGGSGGTFEKTDANITSWMLQWQELGQPNYGFVLYGTAGWDDFGLVSAESGSQYSRFDVAYLLEPVAPVAAFTINRTTGPRYNNFFTFTDTTDIWLYAEDSYLWEYRHESDTSWTTFSTSRSPSGVYFPRRGDYDIRFTVTNEVGSDTDTQLACIHVWTLNAATLTLPASADNGIEASIPNTNNGTATTMGLWSTGGNAKKFLLKYDLATIPVGARIYSATGYYYVDSSSGSGTTTTARVLRDWGELTSTWNIWTTASSWTTAGCGGAETDYTATGASGFWQSATGWNSWDLTSIAMAWVDQGASNYGIVGWNNGVTSWIRTRNYSGTASDPYLTARYMTPPVAPVPSFTATSTEGSLLYTFDFVDASVTNADILPTTLTYYYASANTLSSVNPNQVNLDCSDDETRIKLENSAGSIVRDIVVKFNLTPVPWWGGIAPTATSSTLNWTRSAWTSSGTVNVRGAIRDFTALETTWNSAKTGTLWGTAGCQNASTDYTTAGEQLGCLDTATVTTITQALLNGTEYGFWWSSPDNGYCLIRDRSGTPTGEITLTLSFTPADTQWAWYRRLHGTTTWTLFSTAQNPTGITFTSPGYWDIKLVVTNDYTSAEFTRDSYIWIWTRSDTYIDSSHPTTCYGALTTLTIGNDTASTGLHRGIIRFDFETIPDDAYIYNAKLYMYYDGTGQSNSLPLPVYTCLKEWYEWTATWNFDWYSPGISQAGTDYRTPSLDVKTITFGTPAWYNWNVTTQVQRWIWGLDGGRLGQWGFVFSNYSPTSFNGNLKTFYSLDHPTPGLRPYLDITYGIPPNIPTITPLYPYTKGVSNTIYWSDESGTGAVEYFPQMAENSDFEGSSVRDLSGIQRVEVTKVAGLATVNTFYCIRGVVGVYDNPNQTGTNYYTGGSFIRNVITLGTPVSTTEDIVYVYYVSSGWVPGRLLGTFGGLTHGTKYFYRVKARDLALAETNWSDYESSTQDDIIETNELLIPRGACVWGSGFTKTIEWKATDLYSGLTANANIYLSHDSGETWTLLATAPNLNAVTPEAQTSVTRRQVFTTYRVQDVTGVWLATDPITVGTTTFTGSGLNDATMGGTYTSSVTRSYVIKIDSTVGPDTFAWSDSGGTTWNATNVAITGSAQNLNHGLTITFGATTGHTALNYWTVTAGHVGKNYYTGGSFELKEITLGDDLPTDTTAVTIQYTTYGIYDWTIPNNMDGTEKQIKIEVEDNVGNISTDTGVADFTILTIANRLHHEVFDVTP